MQNVRFNIALKSMVVANIAVIVGAIVTLIWNFAVITTRVEVLTERMDRVRVMYEAVDENTATNNERITVLENGQVLVNGRLLRLENLHFRPGLDSTTYNR